MAGDAAGTAGRRATLVAAVAAFLAAYVVYWRAPLHAPGDSHFALLAADNLLRRGDLHLERYGLGEDYRLEQVGGHQYYWYPPGGVVLSVPFLALYRARGVAAVGADGRYQPGVDTYLNARIAALIAAAYVALLFLTARLLLPLGWSAVVTAGGALGTQVFSTTSRFLGTQTWGVLLVGALALLLLRAATGAGRHPGALLGTLAAWAYMCRPTNALVVAGVAIYLTVIERRALVGYAGAVAVWLAGFVWYAWHNFGWLLPSYFTMRQLGRGSVLLALVGHLVSPSRGWLIFVPAVAWLAVAAALSWRRLRARPLAALALALSAAHLLVVAYYRSWGGYAFGPRLLADTVPWLGLLAVLCLDAVRAAPRTRGRTALAATGALACAAGIAIHTGGAMSRATQDWNVLPASIDRQPERIWDWRQAQFLAPLRARQRPYRLSARDAILFGPGDGGGALGNAWSPPEGDFRWTDGARADVQFTLAGAPAGTLFIELRPYLAPPRLPRQRVEVRLNGAALQTLELREPAFTRVAVAVSRAYVDRTNVLELRLPDAAAPMQVEMSADGRRLGVALRRIAWTDAPPSDGR